MQLFLGNVTTVNPVLTACYTVPAGHRIILRSVAVRNLNGSGGMTCYVRISGTVVKTMFLTTGGTSGDSQEWRPWIVVSPGQVIQMAVIASVGVAAVISGSDYTI